ncbi:MAG TPA: serine/threonine-protein kinase, partial [Gemmatimonadaceae bacterium]|nr:serine/threonine-protein kinase [Gemmatimonadaceae bacterium]
MAASNLEQLQSAIGASYTIERELGRGGMATVYLARDTKHQRPVALKVLQPDLAASLGPERFRREITTAAQLQHPHILGVHDSGETADGQLWFTMPYIEGESLRDRLRRERQLPIEDVVRITREIAGALDYAHDAGVLHRDIKPENILLTKRGDALLADFGIARALASDPTGGTLTMTGLAVGTPQYMSPEQAAGEHGLDARSDVFALGAVCYEMLAGEPPFTGPSQQAIIAKMLSTDAPSVRVLRPGVPPEMDSVLARALSRVPADRWPSAGEFAHAMETAAHASPSGASQTSASIPTPRRRVPVSALALILGVVIGGGLLFAWRAKSGSDAPSSNVIRLAVLPFENIGDSADAYFADGVTDAVRGKLSSVAGLEVIGTSSSAQYRHTTKTPQQIGAELGVRYMLVGRVRWEKGANGTSRVQVSPELLDVRTAAEKWAEPFNAPLTDVFQVQADIADKVAQKLEVALTPAAQQTIAGRPTSDVAAYDAYLRSIDAVNASGMYVPNLHRAAEFAREAVLHDSTFAAAWSQLGNTYVYMYTNGVPTLALADSADKATTRALSLAPNSADAHRVRSDYYSLVRHDPERALSEAEAALALEPRNANVLTAAASREWEHGHFDRALAHAQQAAALDPRDANVLRRLGEKQLRLKRYAEASASLDRVNQLQPGWLSVQDDQIEIALARGDFAAAQAIAKKSQVQGDSAAVAYLADYFDLGWVLDSAQERLLLTLGPSAFDGDRSVWAIARAEQYALHGDRARTRIWADTARMELDSQVEANPNEPQRRVFRGLMLAYLGRCAEAVTDGKRSVELSQQDGWVGPYVQHQLVRIYIACGEKEQAMDVLEPLMNESYYLTPARLRVDPGFEGL